MESVTFKNSRDMNLVGDFYSSGNQSVVIMSHGFTGDRSEHGRFDRIAKSLNEAGYNVLAFDFSGSGESDDDTLTIGKWVDDLNFAITFVKSKGMKNIGLYGHSLGGMVSLACYNPGISAMALTAPVTDKTKYGWDERYSKEQMNELKERNMITTEVSGRFRKKVVIDGQMLSDRENINQKKLLSGVGCPVLIMHGRKDKSVPLSDSERAIELLPKDSELKIFDDENHDFHKHLDDVIKLSKEWFSRYL